MQSTECWRPKPEEDKKIQRLEDEEKGEWGHLAFDVRAKRQANETNPWKGIKPWLKNPNDTLKGFVELKTSENNVKKPPHNPSTEDMVREIKRWNRTKLY